MLFSSKKAGFFGLAAALVCSAVSINAAEISCLPDPKIPRSIKVDKAVNTVLVKDGKVNFELVVPDYALKPAKYAANEAAEFLSKAFGQKITVKNVSSGKVPAIIIGDSKLAAKHGIDPTKFDRDGFVIKTIGKDILIIGRDTDVDPIKIITAFGDKGHVATVFGVHDFLERFAGVRFYFPTELGTIIPRMKNWSVPAINIYDRPDYQQRRFIDDQHSFPNYYNASAKEWKEFYRKQHYLWNRRETIQMPHCHGLGQMNYRRRFGKSNPEFFAMDSVGRRIMNTKEQHLCYSSAIRDEIIADAKAFLTGRPASERDIRDWNGNSGWQYHLFPKSLPCYDIMPDDCLIWCLCEKCKVYNTPAAQTKFMWDFFVDIANQLKAQGVKGYVTSMAYAQYRIVPDVEIPDNLLIMPAIRGPWNELTPDVRDAETRLLKAWNKKLNNKVYIWVYPGKYPNVAHQGGWPDISHTTPRVMASFFQRTRDYVSGVYCGNNSDHAVYNYLTNYICGKMMWNLDENIDELLSEHARLMFGAAAKPMQEFYESLERNWMKIAANAKMGPAGPETFYPSENTLWEKIYTAEEVERISKLFAESKKLVANSPEHLKRVELIEKVMWLQTVRAAEKFRQTQNNAANWRVEMKSVKGSITIDGELDEADWATAGKVYLSPINNAERAEVKTSARMLQDKDNYYFAFECEEPLESMVTGKAHDTNQIYYNSTLELFLIPDRNPKHYWQWTFNADGSFCDLYRPNGKFSTNSAKEMKWESNLEFKVKNIPGKMWVIEARIPRSCMPAASPDGILAEFCRSRVVKQGKVNTQYYSWTPTGRYFGDSTRFGTLTLKPETRVNLLPAGDFNFSNPIGKDKRRGGAWGSSNAKTGFLRDSEYFVSGTASARLEGADRMDITCPIKLKPNTEYILSFYCRMENVRAANIKTRHTFAAHIFDGSGKHLVMPRGLQGTVGWNRIECKFKTDPAAGKLPQKIGFLWRNAAGRAWVDHVEIYEVTK